MTARPRLALFLPRLSRYGGVEGFGYRLAASLVEAGVDVDFVCTRQDIAPPPGVAVVKVPRPGLTRADKILWFAWGAERVMRRGGHDLTISLGKTWRADILRLSGGPLDVFWRLSSRAWPAGLPRAWKMLRRRLSPASPVIRRIEAEQLKNSGTLVAVSHKVVEWLHQAYPWTIERPMDIIYNKPDLARFPRATEAMRASARQALAIAQGEVAIGTAGTNFALKGVATQIEALARLPQDHILLVAGGRNPGRFKHLAERLGLGGRVRFLGRVDDMPGFYQALDAFCLPSFYDTCSNAVLEALASGCRVVSSADNGSSYFLPPESVLADAGDPAALAEILSRALASPPPLPFSWPADIASGVEPYVRLIRNKLGLGEPEAAP